MAIHNTYYPDDIDGQVLFHEAQPRILNHALAIPAPSTETTPFLADNEKCLYLLKLWQPSIRAMGQAGTAYVKQVLNGPAGSGDLPTFTPPTPAPANPLNYGARPRMFAQIAEWMKRGGCTLSIKEDMLWIGAAVPAPDPGMTKPLIKVRYTTGEKAELLWVKGPYDGMAFKVDRGAGYVNLDTDLRPNYTDNWLPPVGQSAIVKYIGQYIYKGQPFGQWSDPVQITLAGPPA